ncbi:MAG: tRNA 4-thiouridine(8) synthase ThiI [Actinobacteria bacterium]|nr:tRNA 4-thiouridine(8) synthase ThiI [Actinomycetota bacterium]
MTAEPAHGPPDVLLIHYHEIGLKGRNRSTFERALKRNLAGALGEAAGGVRLVPGRVEVRSPGPEALDRVLRVFGVANAAPAWVVPADLDMIVAAGVEVARRADADSTFATFAVRARKARTDFGPSSQRVNEVLGEAIRIGLDKRVDLSKPQTTVRVEIVENRAYVSAQKFDGPGGLPVGTAGPVVSLLSAGIDSPVATWRLMRRGADPIAVHFHGQPFTDRSSEQKVARIVARLQAFGYRRPWWSIPMGEQQREITLAASSSLRVLLYRRLMLRVAEAVAEREGALAVVTGESLGQVASQTLENLGAVGVVATRPLLRPLVGTDKAEIIAEAERIGTFEISAEAHQDCCTLFEPRDPATRASAAELDTAEDAYDVGGMVKACLEAAQVRSL